MTVPGISLCDSPGRRARLVALLAAVVLSVLCVTQAQAALTPEQATHVGGDLTVAGKKLAALKESGAKILDAVPRAGPDFSAALGRIAEAKADRPFATHLQLMALAAALLAASVLATRWITRRLRAACLADALHSRGATGLLALDLLDRAVLSGLAYVLSQLWFADGALRGSPHDLLGIALLWSIVRWWFAMWLVETLLRPGIPQFRLVSMETEAARTIKRVAAFVLYVGIASISLLPLLLRAEMPLPSAQVVALVQGLVVAVGGVIGMVVYRRHHLSRRPTPVAAEAAAEGVEVPVARPAPRMLFQRVMFALAGVLVVALWLSWTVGVLALEFSIYHSLVWSLRIAA